jgi:hypothetical protein
LELELELLECSFFFFFSSLSSTLELLDNFILLASGSGERIVSDLLPVFPLISEDRLSLFPDFADSVLSVDVRRRLLEIEPALEDDWSLRLCSLEEEEE